MSNITVEVLRHATEWLMTIMTIKTDAEVKQMRDNPDVFWEAASLTTLTPLEILLARELLKICPFDDDSLSP